MGSLSCKQDFGPKGGQSPVEHRGNLYIRTSSPGGFLGFPWTLIGLLEAGMRPLEGLSGALSGHLLASFQLGEI